MLRNPLAFTVSAVEKDRFENEMKKACQKVCDQKQCEDVSSKCTISEKYSIEIKTFAKTLPNYDKLAIVFSKEQLESWRRLINKFQNPAEILGNFDPTEQEPKIIQFLEPKQTQLDAVYNEIYDIFTNKLTALAIRSTKAQESWWNLNYVNQTYNSSPEEVERGKESYSLFKKLFDDYISLVDEKGIKAVKDEMTKQSPTLGKDLQSIHDVLIGFPNAMCGFIDAMAKNSGLDSAAKDSKPKRSDVKGKEKQSGGEPKKKAAKK